MNPFIHDVVAEAVRRQPWYQRNANTIVSGLVALSAVLSFVATLGLDLPPSVAAGIPVAVTAIGTMVTKLTRNGVQMSTAPKLEATDTAKASLPATSASPVIATESPAVAAERARTYVGAHRIDG